MISPRKVLAVTLLVVAGALTAALPVAAADQQVVMGKDIASHGTLLVASANGMTVYTFTKDVANSGTSNCTGGCLTKWPALTVDAGNTPAGTSGLTSHLGTITRSDNGALQVTFDGKPLYFFGGDSKPGDTNGIYPNWEAVSLESVLGATSPPTSAAATGPADGSTNVLIAAIVAIVGLALAGVYVARRRLFGR